MNVIYENSADFDDNIKSGIMMEFVSAICIEGHSLKVLLTALNQTFKTNLKSNNLEYSDLELFIWIDENNDNYDSFEIMLNDKCSSAEKTNLLMSILKFLTDYQDYVQTVRIKRESKIDPVLVEQLLKTIKQGDIVEDVIANIPKLCLIDSETYQRNPQIAGLIDEFEDTLFRELVNKKIRVNGKGGVLKEVNGTWSRYGFFETGVKKNYTNLSLVEKIGTKTIRSLVY